MKLKYFALGNGERNDYKKKVLRYRRLKGQKVHEDRSAYKNAKRRILRIWKKIQMRRNVPKTQEDHLILPYTEKECSILLKVRNIKHWGLLLIPKLVC